MVGNGAIRIAFAPLGALLLLMGLAVAPTLAKEPSCPVHVTPRAAPAGTIFRFDGTGKAPTGLTIQKGNAEPIGHTIDLRNDDAWDVSVTSRPGDEGLWAATFWQKTDPCATVYFRVTLTDTATAADIAVTPSSNSPALVLLYLAVTVAGLAGGLVVGRMRRAHSLN